MSSLRTPLSRVEGLGSAKSGTHDFWMQRLTAVALVFLAPWFALSALQFVGADPADVADYLSEPWNTVLMLLFLVALAKHLSIGMQVIIEDYFHHEGLKLAAILMNRFGIWLIAAAAAYSVLRIAL